MLGINPEAAEWEASMLSLCFEPPPPLPNQPTIWLHTIRDESLKFCQRRWLVEIRLDDREQQNQPASDEPRPFLRQSPCPGQEFWVWGAAREQPDRRRWASATPRTRWRRRTSRSRSRSSGCASASAATRKTAVARSPEQKNIMKSWQMALAASRKDWGWEGLAHASLRFAQCEHLYL